MSDEVKKNISIIVRLLIAVVAFSVFISGYIENYKENKFITENRNNPDMVQNGVTIKIESIFYGRREHTYNAIVTYDYNGETRRGRVPHVARRTPIGTEFPIIVDDNGWMHQINTQKLNGIYIVWLLIGIALVGQLVIAKSGLLESYIKMKALIRERLRK